MATFVKSPIPIRGPSILDIAWTGLRAADKAEKKASNQEGKPEVAHPKEEVSQHGTYMAVVRRLACRRCGKAPPSERLGNQFCHGDEGKGMGLKTDVREGWAGCAKCHREVGEGKMPRAEKRRLNKEYAASTRAEVEAKGLWPKSLPKWRK